MGGDSPSLETGDYASQSIPVRGRIHDGAGAYDYTVDGPIEAGGNFANTDDPVDMRGQKEFTVFFEASKTATLSILGAEKNPAGGYFTYALYDTRASVAGSLVTKTLTITEDPLTWCATFPITVPYIVIIVNNDDGANANNVYVRIL